MSETIYPGLFQKRAALVKKISVKVSSGKNYEKTEFMKTLKKPMMNLVF